MLIIAVAFLLQGSMLGMIWSFISQELEAKRLAPEPSWTKFSSARLQHQVTLYARDAEIRECFMESSGHALTVSLLEATSTSSSMASHRLTLSQKPEEEPALQLFLTLRMKSSTEPHIFLTKGSACIASLRTTARISLSIAKLVCLLRVITAWAEAASGHHGLLLLPPSCLLLSAS